MKKLLLLLALVLSCGLASFADDFTVALGDNAWNWPEKSYSTTESTYVNGDVTITAKNIKKQNGGIIMAKGAGYIILPKIVGQVTSITFYTIGGASTGAAVEVYDGAVSLGTKNLTVANLTTAQTMDIDANKQPTDPTLKIAATNSKNVQLSKVIVTYTVGGVIKDPAGLEYAETEFTVEVGEEFTAPELVNPNNLAVTYDSSDKTVATVDAEGNVTVLAVGTTTITATSAETETYKKGEASYTLTVTPANVVYNADFTVDEVFTFEQSGSYPWSWDKTYGLKGSAYVSGKANATDVVAASAVIDLTNRVAPIEFTINHALNQYKLNNVLINVAEVGEYAKIVARVEGETEWTEIAVPEVTKFSWTYFNQTINLDQFSGKKIQIGFRYISTAQIAGTWEIKTVTLTAPKGTPAPVAPAAPVVTMGEKTVTVTVEEGCTAYYKFVVVNDQPAIETFALEADTWYPVENNTIDLTKLPMTSGNEKLQLTVKAVNADNVESEVYTTEPFANPGGTTGIADIELGEEAPAEYYNLQGVRMEGELTPGLYIRRQGNKATKVIVK